MTDSRIVVFSGFHARVVESAKPSLRARQITVISQPLPDSLESNYFDTLIGALAQHVAKNGNSQGVRILAFLASCVGENQAVEQERKTFFPIMRRIAFPPTFRRDINQAQHVVNRIVTEFTADSIADVYRCVRPTVAPVLCLPVKNAGSERLIRDMLEVYELRSHEPSRNLDKYVIRLRNRQGVRIKDMRFCGRTNNNSHPIRRRTHTDLCDVASRLRFGFSVPARFEFDVSCESGLAGKTFQHCDGSAEQIARGVTHLNMRINDDFGLGKQT